MVTLDEVLKKQKQQQQQQTQQDQNTQTLRQKLMGNNQSVDAEKTLKQSLENEVNYTAFSKNQIKTRAKKAGDFLENTWHTITDEDKEHGIKDYSEYKHYKSLLDNADENVDKTAVYKQMANEGVIDFDKFTAYEDAHKNDVKPFEKYNKAVEDIKGDFNNKISNALSPYMKDLTDSYQLNAVTKAIERMNNQFGLFVDSYAGTYKSTRDDKLLEDFNNILTEYSNDIINFTKQWAGHLVNEGQGGMKAYYNTLNDEGMRSIANNISSIQIKAENRMAQAAIKDNFGDSWEAFKSGNLISSVAELFGAAANSANWILDKAGNLIEEGKQAGLGWYDVVEELNHLNVYSNDAGALEKAFGTMGSWVASIVDAAPTIGPVVVDLLFGTKTGITGIAKGAKLSKTAQRAERIDDVANALFKSKKSIKTLAKAEDLVELSTEGSTLGARYIKNLMDDVLLFDIGFQQFEGRPLSDDDMALNMLFNLPLDLAAARLAKGARYFKAGLSDSDLITDTISDDALKMFKKGMERNKGAGREAADIAEDYYMLRSIETSVAPKKVYTLEQIKDLPNGNKLVDYIQKVQQESKNTWDRLNTFGMSNNDMLLEVQSALAKTYNGSTSEKLSWGLKKLQANKDMANKFREQIVSKSSIGWIQGLINNNAIDNRQLKIALDKAVKGDDGFKELLYAIFSNDNDLYNSALKKIANSGLEPSQTEIASRLNKTVSQLIQGTPDLLQKGDIVAGYIKNADNNYQNMFNPKEVLTSKDFINKLGYTSNEIEFNKIDSESFIENINNILEGMQEKGKVDVTSLFENNGVGRFINSENVEDWIKTEEGTTKLLWKKNPHSVAMNTLLNKAGLNIEVVDNKLIINGDRQALIKLRNSFEKLSKFSDVRNISDNDWVAYRLMFAQEYSNMFQSNIQSYNNMLSKAGKDVLTDKEVETLSKNWKYFTDELFQKKPEKVTPNNRKIISDKPNEAKSGMDIEGVNNKMASSINGETSAIEVEQEASKAVIKQIMFNPKVVDGKIDRQSLKEEIKNLFKQKTAKNVAPGDGNMGYATVREEYITMTDEDALDNIADKIINTVDVFNTNTVEEKKAVFQTVAEWFSAFAMTPQSAFLLKESNTDFYSTILARITLKDKKASTLYVQKMQQFIDGRREAFKGGADLSKDVKRLYEYNGKVGNIKAGVLQIEEGINQIKNAIDNEAAQNLIPGVKEQIESRFAKLTNGLFNPEDFEGGIEIANRNYKKWIKRELMSNKELDLNNLTQSQIKDIADFLAQNELIKSNNISKEFYKTLYNGYLKGFDVVKKMSKPNNGFKFRLSKAGDFANSLNDNVASLGVLDTAFILGSIKNENLAASTIVHEATHQGIYNGRKGVKVNIGDAVESGMRKAEDELLAGNYFGGSMLGYVQSLKDKLIKAIKENHKLESNNSLLYNYTNQYTRTEVRDAIKNKYSRDNFIDTLVNKYNTIDTTSWDLFLANIVNDEDIKLLDELITEYSSLAAIGEAGYKFVNSPYINEALSILEKAADVYDRFRILCIEKGRKILSEEDLRARLSASFDAADLELNKSMADNMSDFISQQIVKRAGETPTQGDGIKYVQGIQNALGVKNVNTNVQSAADVRSEILNNVTEYIKKGIKSNGDKLSKEDKQELREIRTYIDNMDNEEVVYFLDMLDGVSLSPKKIIDEFIVKPSDWSEEGYREVIHNKYNGNPIDIDINNIDKEEGTAKTKAINSVINTMYNGIDKRKISKSIPLLASLSSMAGDMGVLNGKYLTAISKYIGDEDATISATKLLIGDNTHKAYLDYVANIGNEIPMDEATFITNRIVANVLNTYGRYNKNAIDALNNQLYQGQISALLNDLRFTQNNDNPNIFKQLFDLVNNSTKETLSDGSIIGEALFKVDADTILKKATPGDLDKFNKAVSNYLYANMRGADDTKYINNVSSEFKKLVNNYLSITNPQKQEADKLLSEGKITIKEYEQRGIKENWLGDIADKGFIPRVLAGENLSITHLSKEDRQLKRAEAAIEYMDGLTKLDSGRYELTKKSFLPQLLNFLNDIVDSGIVSLKKGVSKKSFIADFIGNVDQRTFENFGKSYYEFLNKFEEADEKKQIELFKTFSNYWCNSLSRKLGKNKNVLGVSKGTKGNKLEDRFYKKSFADYLNNKNIKDYYTVKETIEEEGIKNIEEVDETSKFKYDLEDFIDDGTEDIKEELYGLDDAGNEIDFGFRNADNDLIQENVQSMYGVTQDTILDNQLETIINGSLTDKMLEPYKILYDDNFLIDENINSEIAKGLSANLGIYYNRVRGVEGVNKNIDKMYNSTMNALKKQGENVEQRMTGELWNKLKSFKAGNFTSGKPIQIANNFGVDKLLGANINGGKVNKIVVELGNGMNYTYSVGKEGVQSSMKDMPIVNVIYGLLPSVTDNKGIGIKLLDIRGNSLYTDTISKTNIWNSFVGQELIDKLGMPYIRRDINEVRADGYRKLLGLNEKGLNVKLGASEMIDVSKAMGVDNVAVNTDAIPELLYSAASQELDYRTVMKTQWQNAKKVAKDREELKTIDGAIDRVNSVLERLSAIKRETKKAMPEEVEVAYRGSTELEKIKSLEITNIPSYVRKGKDKKVLRRTIYVNEDGVEMKTVDKYIDATDGNVNQVFREYPDGRRELIKQGASRKPVGMRVRYNVIQNTPEDNMFEGIYRAGVDTEIDYNAVPSNVLLTDTSDTVFDLNATAEYISNILTRDEQVLSRAGDDFAKLNIDYDDGIYIILKDEITGETIEGTFKQIPQVNQQYGNTYKVFKFTPEGSSVTKLSREKDLGQPAEQLDIKRDDLVKMSPVEQANVISNIPKENRKEFYAKMLDRLNEEKDGIRERLANARELGDLSENADYQQALDDQQLLEARIKSLKDLISKMEDDVSVNIGKAETADKLNEFVIGYSNEKGRKEINDTKMLGYVVSDDGKLVFDENGQPLTQWFKGKEMGWREYQKVEEAAKKARQSEIPELTEEYRRGENNQYSRRNAEFKKQKEDAKLQPDNIAKAEINNVSLQEHANTIAEDFANQFDTYKEIENASEASNNITALTNYYLLGNDPFLVEMRGARGNLLSRNRDELQSISEDWNRVFSKMSDDQAKEAIKDIRNTLSTFRKNNKGVFKSANPMGMDTPVEYKKIVNRLAKVFNDEGWRNVDILGMITDRQSIDNIISKLTYSDALSVIGLNEGVHNMDEARNLVMNWAKQFVSEKRALQVAKDFVGDPLGTGKAFRAMANIRSAYRFAKYSLLSPVSGTIMYINSKWLGDTLFVGKRKGLEGMLANKTFNEIIDRDDVLTFLNREKDIIANSSSDIMNKGLFVNEWLNKVADTLTKKGTQANDTLKTILNGGIHSLYDKEMSGEVRKLAFAQALKQNHIYDWQLESLLQSLKDGSMLKDAQKSVLWNKITADAEEFYARFFTNAGTQSLSRHKWSRLWGFNFLQGYVINRTDEMLQGFRQWGDFVRKAGGFKNITWNDITKHLNEDNQELKSFMNNVIASVKLGYYLDKAADSDGSEADNIKEYFINSNDYLSSLDTVWFMRLFKAPLEGVSAYKTYSEWSGEEATMIGGIKVGVMESFAEICSQFFREGKFLSAMLNPIIAGMKTGDLDFAGTVAGTEWEKMANSLGRFGLVDGMEKYGLEDFSEDSDVIGQMLLATDKTTLWGQEQKDLYDITNVDKIINDPTYSAITAIGYLPLVGELIKYAADKGGYAFSEAKYREMMEMVDNDPELKKLYNGEIDSEVFSDDAINRIWSDFTSFNYPYKTLKSPGKHSVGNFSNGVDMTLNTMKEDVFVQNICEKLGMSIEQFHQAIISDSAKTTGKLKIMAAAEAAEPGSGKIVLSYIMANRLYELEKEYTGKNNPATADIPEDVMPLLKREVLEEYGNEMFTADKASWYKAIREYISEANPEVFKTLYNNNTLNSYVSSVGFLDMLMRDAAQKGDVNAKYIKNVFSVMGKYVTNESARVKMVEHMFGTIDNLNAPQTVKNMAMEGVLAGNIDFYNRLKNSPALSALYSDVLDSFEHRVWGVMDNVDIQDDRMYRQGYNKYTPYTSQYGNDNKKVDDELKNKVGNYYKPLTSGGKGLSSTPVYSRTKGNIPVGKDLDWYWKYYERLIKDYSDKLVKSEGKKYPAQTIEGMTFKTGSNNRGSIKGQQLSFPKHKSKQYRTNVLSNLPGSHG